MQDKTCLVWVKSLRLVTYKHKRFLSLFAGLSFYSCFFMLYNSLVERATDWESVKSLVSVQVTHWLSEIQFWFSSHKEILICWMDIFGKNKLTFVDARSGSYKNAVKKRPGLLLLSSLCSCLCYSGLPLWPISGLQGSETQLLMLIPSFLCQKFQYVFTIFISYFLCIVEVVD